MANYATLKAAIQQVVKTNGNNEITGALLQQSLFAMINSLGSNYLFVGIAQPSTNPGTPDQNVFYLAGPGTYPNFNASEIPPGYLGILKYDGTWHVETTVVGKNYDSTVEQLRLKTDGLIVVDYTIERGSIASTTGADSSSTTRLRTAGYITGTKITVVPGDGKAMAFAYNDYGYIKNTDWLTETTNIQLYGATKYRVVYAKTNDYTINVSDFETLNMDVYRNDGIKAGHLEQETDIAGDNTVLFNKMYNKNYCNPSEIIVKSGAYIKPGDGTYHSSGSTGAAGVTGFIPVFGKALSCNNAFGSSAASWAAYRRPNASELIDTSITKYIVGNDVVIYSHGGGASNAKYYQYVDGDIYVRFTLANITNVMVNEGALPVTYTPYEETIKLNGVLIGKDIGIDNIKETEIVFNGKNRCDPSKCNFTNHYYIDASNGFVKSPINVSAGITGMIPIDENGLYCPKSLVAGTVIGYAYYDERGNYLTGYYDSNRIPGCTSTFAKYIDGAKYVVFSLSSSSDVMVSAGNQEIEYEEYAGEKEVISKNILPVFSNAPSENKTFLDGVSVVLPPEIVITQTDRLQLFYRDIITAFEPYNFSVVCICSVGKPTPRCFEYSPVASAVGHNYTLTIRIYDNAHRLVSSATTTIKVVANAVSPSSAKNILLVGASTLYDGTVAKEINRRFNDTSGDGTYYNPTGLGLSNIALVGRTTTSNPSVNQESQSGWQWKDYATSGRAAYRFFVNNISSYELREGAVYSGAGTLKFTITEINMADGYFSCTYEGSGTQPASGTLTKYSGDGSDSVAYDSYNIDSRNPFWNNQTSQLDFNSYVTEHCGGHLEIFVSYLGINDIFQTRTPHETIELYVKPFIRTLHTQLPGTKVILCNLHIPSPFGGMGRTYGATAREYWTMCAKYFEYIRELNVLVSDTEFSGWVSIASTFQEFDSENLYPVTSTRTICNRSETIETIQSDGVHPTTSGKKAISDSIYHKITQLL